VRYHTVHRTWLRTLPAATADNAAIGAWVRVSAYAADLELGIPDGRVSRRRPLGRALIGGCRAWGSREWLAICSVDRESVDAMALAGLAAWDGNDLLLEGYDLWGEKSYGKMRHDPETPGEAPGENPGQAPGEGRSEQSQYRGRRSKKIIASAISTGAAPHSGNDDSSGHVAPFVAVKGKR